MKNKLKSFFIFSLLILSFTNVSYAKGTPATDNKININTANIKVLTTVRGIGNKKAQAIVDYRKKNGSFKSIDQLKHVKGISDKMLNKIKSHLRLK